MNSKFFLCDYFEVIDMAYCKHFIDGINTINFSDSSGRLLQQSLMALVYQALKKEQGRIQENLSTLPLHQDDNPFAEEQLSLYRKKQTQAIDVIDAQMQAILADNRGVDLESEKIITDPTLLIQSLAENFRDVKHLAYVLSDAPSEIKALQTSLYIKVLFKLESAAQEAQLQTLALVDIQDMLAQAILMYERHPTNPQLRQQCQKLVQMGYYEMVRRDCDHFKPTHESTPYEQYQGFIRTLRSKCPEVGASDIIDQLSHYKSTTGESMSDLLTRIEVRLTLNERDDWARDDKINAFKEKKALFDVLRFGQADRRDYAKKTESNLTRDLFWARNIRDVELFTKNSVADQTFTALAEGRFIEQDSQFKSPYQNSEDPRVAKLKETLDVIYSKSERTKKGIVKTGGRSDPFILTEATAVKKYIKDRLEAQSKQPAIRLLPNGEIEVNLYFFETDDALVDTLFDEMTTAGGLGRTPDDKLIRQLMTKSAIHTKLHSSTIRGETFAEIEAKLHAKGFKGEELKAYQAAFQRIQRAASAVAPPDISALKLDNKDELLLRELLELQSIQAEKMVRGVFVALQPAFKQLKEGRCIEALKIEGLEAHLSAAYAALAQLDTAGATLKLKPMIEKAKTITASKLERREKSNAIQAAFESGREVAKTVEAIFLDEYHAMADTLALTADEVRRMEGDIKVMADEMVRLIERTRQGAPAITDEEQTAYFSIIQQLANAIQPKLLSEVQFKVKHSVTGACTVQVLDDKGGLVQAVQVDIGAIKLPYSLIKPPGRDFIFSYGGSRGIIAPFEGLDEAYAGTGKKGRLFTHSRLLGVGQYGQVKEVESLLSGLNQVIKKGYVPAVDSSPAFKEASRTALRTRPITARDDPLYRIESDVLQNLSKAERAISGGTHYWITDDKPRKAGKLFSKDSTPRQYQLLTERAKGDTLADTANKKLNLYPKGDIAYHDPLKRDPHVEGEFLSTLKDTLDLSEALVGKAQAFQAMHFSHNDIKPENFLYKKNSEGHYEVKYIDWATGGFQQVYQGTALSPEAAFSELFGPDLPKTFKDNQWCDANGRFVKQTDQGMVFGVNPTLGILHGARNGTLPYISPKVLGDARDRTPVSGSEPVPELNTVLTSDESYMDDWALTAMTFGICNRQAYLTLVKGRVVMDYVIPGVLELDGKTPLGLKIVDVAKFNQFFACANDEVSDASLQNGTAYTQRDAVMYIPSNQREGEPLHLYRRLQGLHALLAKEASPDAEIIANKINRILSEAHRVIASGEGFTKVQLKEHLAAAEACIKDYDQLHDLARREALLKEEILQSVLQGQFSVDQLLKLEESGLSRLEILCTYPSTREQKVQAIAILEGIFNEAQLNDKLIIAKAPGRHLFRDCIQQGQSDILQCLLEKITTKNPAFIALVRDEGLLHYAAEQGMTGIFSSLISALKKAGATDEALFNLLLIEYGPKDTQIKTAPHVKWAMHCFHIAIRNNDPLQLTAILNLLPQGDRSKAVIHEALHLSAALGHKALFNQILTTYNALNPENKMSTEELLSLSYPPDDVSPYHLLMRDEATLEVIPWQVLEEKPEVLKAFLLTPPKGTHAFPLLIAAKNGNFAGVRALIQSGEKINLSKAEWSLLFTQSDEHGKNLFNYVLEQNQFTVLTELLNHIKQQGEEPETIIVRLLSNPHPTNPLSNFLSTEKQDRLQFEVLNQLFNEISADFKNPVLQKARIVTLLVNENWLIEKASSPVHHEALEALLQNDKLSIPYKQGLFTKLALDAPEASPAKHFYSALLAEVSPPHERPRDESFALELPVDILQEVARQRNDVSLLMKALLQAREFDQLSLATERLKEQERNTEFLAQSNTLSLHNQALQDALSKQAQESQEALQRMQFTLSAVHSDNFRLNESLATTSDAAQLQIDTVERREAELRLKFDNLNAQDKALQEEQAKQIKRLQEALDAANKEKHDLDATLQGTKEESFRFESQWAAAEGKVLEFSSERRELMASLDALQKEKISELRVHQAALAAVRQEKEALQVILQQTQTEGQAFKSQSVDVERRVVELNLQLQVLTSKNESLLREQVSQDRAHQAQLQDVGIGLQRAEEARQAAKLELETVEKKANQQSLVLDNLKVKHEALQEVKTTQESEFEAARKEIQAKIKEIQNFHLELRKAKEESNAAALQLEVAGKTETELKGALSELSVRYEGLQAKQAGQDRAHQVALAAVGQEKDALQASLQQIKEDGALLKTQSLAAERRSAELKVQLQDLTSKNKKLLIVQASQEKAHQSQIQTLESKLQRAESRLGDAAKTETELSQRLSSLTSTHEVLQAKQIGQVEGHQAEQKARLEEIEALRAALNRTEEELTLAKSQLSQASEAMPRVEDKYKIREQELQEQHESALEKYKSALTARMSVLHAANTELKEDKATIEIQKRELLDLKAKMRKLELRELKRPKGSKSEVKLISHRTTDRMKSRVRALEGQLERQTREMRDLSAEIEDMRRNPPQVPVNAPISPAVPEAPALLDRAVLEQSMAKIRSLQEIRADLNGVIPDPMVWLNPAFQDSAQQYALDLANDFKELAEGGEQLLTYLNQQRALLQRSLNGLKESMTQPINEYRTLLTGYLEEIDVELALHNRMQTLLKGNLDPVENIAHQALLKTITQATDAAKDVRQVSSLFDMSYQDHILTEKDKYLETARDQDEVNEEDESDTEISWNEACSYKTVDRVKSDSFREHTVSKDNQLIGRFIEERTAGLPDGAQEPKVKMTVVAFPGDDDPKARVLYAMALVTQILAGLKAPPTPEKPLVLRGSNKEELAYLLAALKVAGESSPHMQFSLDAITVEAKNFSDAEIKQASATCYQENFENSDLLPTLKKDIEQLATDKFGHAADHQAVKALTKHVGTLFKTKVQDILKDIKEEDAAKNRGPNGNVT